MFDKLFKYLIKGLTDIELDLINLVNIDPAHFIRSFPQRCMFQCFSFSPNTGNIREKC